MAEKRSFWSTMPGMVTAIASIVTGMAVLIPLMLGISHNKKPSDTNSSTAIGGVTSTASPSVTPTSTDAVTGTAAPDATPGESLSPGAGALVANPAHLDFGRVSVSSAPGDKDVTLRNTGSSPLTVDDVALSGPNANVFAISSTSCGSGSAIPAGGSCQVGLRYAPTLGSQTAALVVKYHPPQGASAIINLTASAALL